MWHETSYFFIFQSIFFIYLFFFLFTAAPYDSIFILLPRPLCYFLSPFYLFFLDDFCISYFSFYYHQVLRVNLSCCYFCFFFFGFSPYIPRWQRVILNRTYLCNLRLYDYSVVTSLTRKPSLILFPFLKIKSNLSRLCLSVFYILLESNLITFDSI